MPKTWRAPSTADIFRRNERVLMQEELSVAEENMAVLNQEMQTMQHLENRSRRLILYIQGMDAQLAHGLPPESMQFVHLRKAQLAVLVDRVKVARTQLLQRNLQIAFGQQEAALSRARRHQAMARAGFSHYPDEYPNSYQGATMPLNTAPMMPDAFQVSNAWEFGDPTALTSEAQLAADMASRVWDTQWQQQTMAHEAARRRQLANMGIM